jgi:chaperonin GroEL
VIVIGNEAREKMLEGINLTANAVKPTLGPMARTVVLKEHSKPIIVNDGVTVARAIHHEDEFVDMGAKLLIEVATQAQNLAGDGTTTACVLAQAFCQVGMGLIEEGENPVMVAESLKEIVHEISGRLLEDSHPIENSDEIKNVATIAANNDDYIGGLIAEAIEKVGKDGVITVNESKDMNTTIEVVQGLEIDRGYRTHHLATDKEKNQTVMENPLILVSNFNIIRFQEIIPILEKVAETKRPLLLISRGLEQHAISNLIVNVMGGVVQCCAIESPDYGFVSDTILEDISIVVGANFLDYQTNIKMEEVEITDLGEAEKVVVGEIRTTIIGGSGKREKVEERANMITNHIEDADNEFMADKMRTRVAKLLGGVAVLNVGAASEVEMRDKMERIDDALNATRAAMEMGVISGGGTALAETSLSMLDKTTTAEKAALLECLLSPYEQILINAGIDYTEKKYQKKKVELPHINAKNAILGNMYAMGIIDPVKVTISSLNSAASVAALVLTSEVLVGEEENETVQSPPMF